MRPIPSLKEGGEVPYDELPRPHIRVATDTETTIKSRAGRRAPACDPRGTIEANTSERTQSRDRHVSDWVAGWRDSGSTRDLRRTSAARGKANQESYDFRYAHTAYHRPSSKDPTEHADITDSDARPYAIVHRTPHVVPWFSIWVKLSSCEVRALEQVRVLELRRGAGLDELNRAAVLMNEWLASAQ